MSPSCRIFILLLAAAAMGKPTTWQQGESPLTGVSTVSEQDLLAQPPGSNWTSYNGDYSGRRYSSLHEINLNNVAQLRAAWIFHPGNSEWLEATPVVIRGIMYVTAANDVYALDARTGRALWHYQRPVSSGLLDDAAAHKNRGVAVWKEFVYTETDDAHLLCLDARSGGLRWDVEYADKAKHYGATSAPLVINGTVIVGTSGGDSGARISRSLRRCYWETQMASLDHSWPWRIRVVELARRFLFAWGRHNLDARHLRSRTRYTLLDYQQCGTRFCGRVTPGRRPLYSLRFGNRSQHGKVEVVFPV